MRDSKRQRKKKRIGTRRERRRMILAARRPTTTPDWIIDMEIRRFARLLWMSGMELKLSIKDPQTETP